MAKVKGEVHTYRAKYQKVATDADQVEVRAIVRGYQTFESGIADERISGSIQDNEDASLPDTEGAQFQRQDLSTEEGAGKIYEEVLRRQQIMGAAYPFNVSGTGVTHVPSNTGLYEFCLAASRSPSLTKGKYVGFVREFERVSAVIVREFLGKNAESLHVGKPRDHAVGKTFYEGMQTAAKQSGEFVWQPDEGLAQVPPTSGDEGVDFIVWRRLDKVRVGSLFLLGQCACGDDWVTKWEDLSLTKLSKWFGPMTWVRPLKAFATPYHAVDGNLNEASRTAGLFFDRARLVLLAEEAITPSEFAPWTARLAPVSNLVLA